MMMIYHWRRGPKNTEVTPLQRPGSGSYGCVVHRWLLAQCWRGVAKGVRKIGREGAKKKSSATARGELLFTLYVQRTLSLTLSFSFSLSSSFFSLHALRLGTFSWQCVLVLGISQVGSCYFYSPLISPEYNPFMFYTPHTHTHTCNVYAHMLTHTLTQSH